MKEGLTRNRDEQMRDAINVLCCDTSSYIDYTTNLFKLYY